jgi:hypothetical protein
MDFELIAVMSKKQSALRTMLQTMNVPKARQDTTNLSNLRWLNRNLAIENKENPMFETAKELVVWLLKNHEKLTNENR